MPTSPHANASGADLHEAKRIKAPVRVASTANVTLTAPGATIDGVTMVNGDRMLLKNQSTGSQNGIYTWVGASSTATRTSDADSAADLVYGFKVYVTEGTTNGGKYYTFTNAGTITLGTTGLTFVMDGVTLSMPAEFTVGGTPGAPSVSKANENANTVWAGPTTGSASTPAFRALVAADIPGIPYANVQDQKTQNTAGGTFTSGAWQTRTLNTVQSDTASIVSLASNQITLQAGTYRVSAIAPALGVDNHQLRLQNITDTATLLTGQVAWTSSSAINAQTVATLRGKFTLAASKAIELQHRCLTTRSTNGFGVPANFTTEVYAVIEIWKDA